MDRPSERRRIVIVGGGFGGLACARALAGADVDVTLVDRNNHHLFQPLLYQVSTAALSPADIAVPIRHTLRKARNVSVWMASVTSVDTKHRTVRLDDGNLLPFDQLILATGSVYDYFGHEDWRAIAPSPKSLNDARTIRSRLLAAFEAAEAVSDPARRRALLTFLVVGGGPTGIELAGTVAELARYTLRGDFRTFDAKDARIILAEAGHRLLSGFPEPLGDYAGKALTNLGVELKLGCEVKQIASDRVTLGDETLGVGAVIWGAGTRAAQGAEWIGGTSDKKGRVPVEPTLAVTGQSGIFALGDVALFTQDGKPLPGLGQVAQQQGEHLGRELRTRTDPRPFRYRSKGDTAVIGRHAAVYSYGKYQLKGRLAWLLWALVHVFLLIGFERRAMVMVQWIWRYFTFERGARLIDRDQVLPTTPI